MKRNWIILILAYSGLFVTSTVLGQVTPDTLKTQIKAIPVPDITAESLDEQSLISDINDYLQDNSEIIEIKDEMDSLEVDIDVIISGIDTTSIELSEIDRLTTILGTYRSVVESFGARLTQRTSQLEDYRQKLREDRLIWDKTIEAASADETPEALLQTLEGVLRNIAAIDEAIVSQQDDVFRIQNRMVEKLTLVQQNIDLLLSLKSDYAHKVFAIDSPPFWRLFSDSIQFKHSTQQLTKNWTNAKITINTYYNRNFELIIIHAVIVVLLIFLILYFKRKQEKFIQYADQKELWLLLNHPVELAIVLGIVVFAPPYRGFPDILWDFVLLIVYLIVVRLFFPVVSTRIKIAFSVLALFLIFNTLLTFIPQVQMPGRLVMLLESVVGIIFIINIYRTGIKRLDTFGIWMGRWMLYLLPLAFLIFSLSVITNLLGAASFTRFLLYGVIRSMAIAISIFAGIMVLNGIIKILLRNPQARAVYIVKEHSAIIEQRLQFITQLLFLFLWIRSIMKSFNLWIDFLAWFDNTLEYTIQLGAFSINIRNILAFLITLIITIWLSKLIKVILEKELFQRMKLPRGVPGVISNSTYYFVLVIGFFIALSQTGVDLSQVSLIIGALGVGIGFGLQGIISNFVSGIILVFERPIQEGDTIEVGPLLGDVTSIGIRSSKVRTYDGSEVIVPNNNLISNEVINWTLSDRKRRLTIRVGVAYGTNPRKVTRILVDTAAKHPKALKDPEPLPIFEGFGDSSLDFKIHFWTYFEDGYEAKSDVSIAIYDALEKEGIVIPFPQRVVTMKKEDD